MISTALPQTCPRCNVPNQRQSFFCDNCRLYMLDSTNTVERVTYNRRIFGNYLLEGVLAVVTLIIGWFIWLIFTSKTGQTPAKRLLNVYVINLETGRRISQGETWLREVVIKLLVVNVVGLIIPFAGLIDGIWAFFDKNRQTLHDKILKQVVVYAPAGLPESMQHEANAPILYQAPPIVPVQTVVADPGAAKQPETVQGLAQDLRELARLRDEGMITPEEYERQRAKLVSRM
jgi:uncharacterized RDD family membrane protein YckC